MAIEESSWGIENNKSYPKLSGNIEADVVIIGAGITGIFNAYVLSKGGLKVVILEKNKLILQGATLYTTAFITNMIDTYFDELVSIFGAEKAKLVWQSGQGAINIIADIIKKENIDCEFKFVSAYTYANNKKQFKKLSKEYGAVKKIGFKADIQENGSKLNFENAGFMEVPDQAKFHPIKFAQALVNLAESVGARIFTDSEIISMDGLTVKTKAGRVQAKDILITTYSPWTNEGTRFRKGMYVSYVFEIEIAKNIIPESLYLDMENPYHYFRIDSYDNFNRMIVGGEDHRKDIKINPDKNFNALEKYVKKVLENNKYKITRKWDGQILEPLDGLPLIGAIKPHIFIATAFSGNGITYSAISAGIIRDIIFNRNNPYSNIYDIKRTPTIKQMTAKGIDYMHEFIGGAVKNFFS